MGCPRLPVTILVSICSNPEGKIEEILLSSSNGQLPEIAQRSPAVKRAFSNGSDRVSLTPPFVPKNIEYHKIEGSDTSQPNENGYVSRTMRYVKN